VREYRVGPFQRLLYLPDSAGQSKTAAKHKNGVLTLTFPKLVPKQPKQLKVALVKGTTGKNNPDPALRPPLPCPALVRSL
jgi:hypothetical protein